MSETFVGMVAEFDDEGRLRRGKVKECVIKDGRCFAEIVYKVLIGVTGQDGFGLAQIRLHVSQFRLIRS